jgi:acylphosphatase
MEQSYSIYGKVQGVMFRKTLILAAGKLELAAGASNDNNDTDCVHFSLAGDSRKIETLEQRLMTLESLNSWGAKATKLIKLKNYKKVKTYEVTTLNIEKLQFTSGVEFYL